MNFWAFDDHERKSLKIMHTRVVNFEIRPKALHKSACERVKSLPTRVPMRESLAVIEELQHVI